MKVLPIENENGAYVFECPGCEGYHKVNTTVPNNLGAKWSFNGNAESPTFNPSVLVKTDRPPHPETRVCHSFIKDGKIQFLNDCTHALAGQTVELPELE